MGLYGCSGTLNAHPDVRRMARLAATPGGDEALTALDYFLHAESLRSAARAANFHHSSLQSRISRISKVLEMDLKTSNGRERAAIALLLWRVHSGAS